MLRSSDLSICMRNTCFMLPVIFQFFGLFFAWKPAGSADLLRYCAWCLRNGSIKPKIFASLFRISRCHVSHQLFWYQVEALRPGCETSSQFKSANRCSRFIYLFFVIFISLCNDLLVRQSARQCFSTFFLQRNHPQMFSLLMEPYAMIQVSEMLQPHRAVVTNFAPGKFRSVSAEPWRSAEPRLKNTAVRDRDENPLSRD